MCFTSYGICCICGQCATPSTLPLRLQCFALLLLVTPNTADTTADTTRLICSSNIVLRSMNTAMLRPNINLASNKCHAHRSKYGRSQNIGKYVCVPACPRHKSLALPIEIPRCATSTACSSYCTYACVCDTRARTPCGCALPLIVMPCPGPPALMASSLIHYRPLSTD